MHGIDEPRGRATARSRTTEIARALAAVPAVVPPALNAVDLFESPLADVTEPEVAVGGVEAPSPRITETPSVDLRTAVGGHGVGRRADRAARKRIVRGNGVWRRSVHVQSKHRSQQVGRVLSGAQRIAAVAAVAKPEIQEAVVPEGNM